jgi:hypothetical protein
VEVYLPMRQEKKHSLLACLPVVRGVFLMPGTLKILPRKNLLSGII